MLSGCSIHNCPLFFRLDHLGRTPTEVLLDNGKKSKRLREVVSDNLIGALEGQVSLGAKDVERLYKSELFFHVGDGRDDAMVRGRVLAQVSSVASDPLQPMLLAGNNTNAVGMAWVNMDWLCSLNYHLRLSGLAGDDTHDSVVVLKDYPMSSLKSTSTMAMRTVEVERFQGSSHEGVQAKVHKLSLVRLNAGDASILVAHEGPRSFAIEGRIQNVSV